MAKISKRADAPEGTIGVSAGASVNFKVTDEPYETTDHEEIEVARTVEYLEVEVDEDADYKAAAREEARLLNKLERERDKADKQRAEKDPQEPAAPKPDSVADIVELEKAKAEEKADAKDGDR